MNTTNEDSMIFYMSFFSGVKAAGLSGEERAEFYEALGMYAIAGEMPNFDNPILQGFFNVCKPSIDANIRKREKHRICVMNGKKGGAPKGNQNARKYTKKTDDNCGNSGGCRAERNNNYDYGLESTETSHETTIYGNGNANGNDNEDGISSLPSSSVTDANGVVGKEEEKKNDPLLHLNQRNLLFFESLKPFFKIYDEKAVQDFYEFWHEPNKLKTLMRFEMEKTWDLRRRLEIWMRKRKDLNLIP